MKPPWCHNAARWIAVSVAMLGMMAGARGQTGEARRATLEAAQADAEIGASLLERDPPGARTSFLRAAEAYERLADSARDGEDAARLWFEAANGYVLADEPARAVWLYRRAERLWPLWRPGGAAVRRNLAVARERVWEREPADSVPGEVMPEQRPEATVSAVIATCRSVPTPGTLLVAGTAAAGFWTACGVLVLRPGTRWRRRLVRVAVVSGAAALLAAAVLGLPRIDDAVSARYVVLPKPANGYVGPDDLAFEAASLGGGVLPAGAEVVVLERRGGEDGPEWARVRLEHGPGTGNGGPVWVKRSSLIPIVPVE